MCTNILSIGFVMLETSPKLGSLNILKNDVIEFDNLENDDADPSDELN